MSHGTRLWLVIRTGDVTYDESVGFVICANTEKIARNYAGDNAGHEGRMIWLKETKTDCKFIGWAAPGQLSGIVLHSYNAS